MISPKDLDEGRNRQQGAGDDPYKPRKIKNKQQSQTAGGGQQQGGQREGKKPQFGEIDREPRQRDNLSD